MGERQVRPLLGHSATSGLENPIASGLVDLNIRATAGLVRKIALPHALASSLRPNEAPYRRSDDEQAGYWHAVEPFSKAGHGIAPCPKPRAQL
ncbi:hypothetical protein JH26_03550 [Microvirga sp. BSC39]|nr:hypothetical protein JH26_03550 [Microvirga sp. BSC39]